MSEKRATWREARKDARAAAAEAWAYHVSESEPGYASDLAHEYADAADDVIYTQRSREVWMDASEVRAYEDEVDGLEPNGYIDQRIMVCVYLAIRAAFDEAYTELADIDPPEYALVYEGNAEAFGDLEELDEVRMAKASPNAYTIEKPTPIMLYKWATTTAAETLGLKETKA